MSTKQQPEALRLADKYEVEGFLQDHRFAQDHWCRQAAAELRRQHARITELEDVADMAIKRIAEMEAQLSAIGAGGVEPLRKSVATPAPNERAAFEAWLRVKPCGAAHDFAWEAWRARAALAATRPTQPAAQGMELANCKGGKWLTVVYHDIQPGDESRTIVEHPKVSALSWLHALHDRDAALAAQAKQGERP